MSEIEGDTTVVGDTEQLMSPSTINIEVLNACEIVKQKKSKDRKKKGSASSYRRKSSRSSISNRTKRSHKKSDSNSIMEEENENAEKSSSENQSVSSVQQLGQDLCSDEQHSSDAKTPRLRTRSKIRHIQHRKAYSSHSSAAESDCRKTKSEPIIITLSDSDDDLSLYCSRPNRTARIKGELIRKLYGAPTKSGTYKTCDSSSSSDYEERKRKKKNKARSVKSSSSHIAKRKKYLVNRLACQSRLNLRKHKKRISSVYRPAQKQRDLKSVRKRFKVYKKEKVSSQSYKIHSSLITRSQKHLVKEQKKKTKVERRSLRNASIESPGESVAKNDAGSEIVKNEKAVTDMKLEAEDGNSNAEVAKKPTDSSVSCPPKIRNSIETDLQLIKEGKIENVNTGNTDVEVKDIVVESDKKTADVSDEKVEAVESVVPPNLSIDKSATAVKKIKKKGKQPDKIIRKRGRPRLTDLKYVREVPSINNMAQIPFLQSSYCFIVAPKLPKCRECLIAMKRTTRTMLHAYCRFMEYRKLFNKNGTILNAGFSEPSEATSEHLNQWLPQVNNPPKDLNFTTSKSLLEHIGDQFCDLIEQEKEAISLHIGKDKVITWKRIVQGVREMCDVCYTTLFNFHWVCPMCGLAVCIDCYKGRKQGIIVEYEEGQPKNRDQFNWLVCTVMRQPHDPERLVLAQIIPGNALWTMKDLLHAVRQKLNIPSYCKCTPQELVASDKYISTGICKQLMSCVTKSFSADRSNLYFNCDSNFHASDNTYDELDIEVTGAALKWLEGTVNANNLEYLKHADDYFNSYEDFTSLRGNLLNGIPDEDISLEEEKEFSSFSLDDIIECMIKPNDGENKENYGKSLTKQFSNRYPQPMSGRDPLPIRIYTKLESNLAFSNVPHSWFCNGRLLFLHQSDHKDNLALFQEQWKRGQPILVKGVDEQLNMDLWHPDAFCRDFGEERNDLVDCKTGAILKNFQMKKFWEGFECFEKRMTDDNGEYMLLKLKDWPPGEDFSEMLPKRFNDLMAGLPLPEYTRRDGILNLAGRLPTWFVRPDLGPKMYNAYGSALYPTKGTTNLHLDVSDAVNVMVYVGIPSDGNAQLHIEGALKAIDEGGCDSLMRARVRARGAKPGALWHIYNARDADKIRDLLTKVAVERGEKLEAHHDPIHDQSWYLDEELRKRLYKDYAVEGYAIAQCLGDAVFIPAGAPHQVRNLHSCVKVAEDFVSPENIAHCFKLTQEFRNLSDTHTNHEDKLQIKNIIYHVVRDALSHLLSASACTES